ncbi:MAG: transposase, partial [Patescibacteria group bacterium]
YNRGVDKRQVFLEQYDVDRFLQSMEEFNTVDPIGSIYQNSFRETTKLKSDTIVDIICFCINPNHFHLLLRQKKDKGIEKFMHRLGVGYSRYFNERNHRSGSLFQGTYKAIHIDSNKYLLYLSAYINLNNKVHKLSNLVTKLTKSSWAEYTTANYHEKKFCNTKIIQEQFSSKKEYKEFAEEALQYIKERKDLYYELQHFLLE